ncbi:DUF1294 domain-containing protein [Thiolapillus brandeum]|uniref:CSD domain-containing protein n=1 Tax=Thiolapillus brandeum TaxID=1076588 RepID=A0A7U6GI10_9GAMM|nr:cold shock and DUF1294 domain-containing protein [Thiolapillus brandeum]BAO43985.1 conserved hypothetical protein [Thiolapillus brandeum]
MQGRLVRWNDDKGFGFINVDKQKRDVFIHISQVVNMPRRPQRGDVMAFVLGQDKDGRPRAEQASIQGLAKRKAGISHGRQRSYNIRGRSLGVPGWILVLAPMAFSAWVLYRDHNILPLTGYLFMSLFTFIAYAYDKKKAIDGQWRTPENTLHVMELLGGWPGGFLAQYKIRHKSVKGSYQEVFWLIVFLHLVLWLDYLLFSGRWIWHPLGRLMGGIWG